MNQTRFIIAVTMTAVMMMMMMTAGAMTVQAMEISDKPSSMEILNLINQYNRDNPQHPIVCSSGFVFPQHDSSGGGSSTSIATQIGNAIDDAVGEVQDHVTGSGGGGNQHENSRIANEEQMREMITHTSTPVPTVNSGDSSNGDGDDSDDGGDNGGNGGGGSDEEGDDSNGGGSSVGGVETEDSSSD